MGGKSKNLAAQPASRDEGTYSLSQFKRQSDSPNRNYARKPTLFFIQYLSSPATLAIARTGPKAVGQVAVQCTVTWREGWSGHPVWSAAE